MAKEVNGRKVVLAGSVRTAVGKMGGTLSGVPVAKLGEYVIAEALKRTGIEPKAVDLVYMGCVLQSAQKQNVARQASINAGLPVETPALTVNIVCGSSLEAINMAARMVKYGEADIVVAGGMENMSAAPFALPKARYGYRLGNGELIDTMQNDGLRDAFHGYLMGITAENVAEKWGITREAMDEFSAKSHQKAAAAREKGLFKAEIVPVEVAQRKQTIVFEEDEGIRPDSTAEALAKLRPAFKDDGIVTAGNSSSINDAASCVVVMSEEKAKELGVKPEVEWLDGALGGVDPAIMGVGPIYACENLTKKIGIKASEFDLVELNEAFAAPALACIKDMNLDPEKVNVNGGAIAIGHPIGASGGRILVTLIHALQQREEAKTGLATMCIGGGMGCAMGVRKYEG